MRQRMMVRFLVVLAAVLVTTQNVQAHGTTLAECILQQPPFAPRDISLFIPQTYPDAPPPEPASAYPVNEEQLRNLVRRTLNQRFHGNQGKIAEGLAVFDSDEIAEIVPDPRLRAGLALLLGTAGESAICSGLQTVQHGLANKDFCRPALCANTPTGGPTLRANGPTLVCKRLANTLLGQH